MSNFDTLSQALSEALNSGSVERAVDVIQDIITMNAEVRFTVHDSENQQPAANGMMRPDMQYPQGR